MSNSIPSTESLGLLEEVMPDREKADRLRRSLCEDRAEYFLVFRQGAQLFWRDFALAEHAVPELDERLHLRALGVGLALPDGLVLSPLAEGVYAENPTDSSGP